MLKSVGAMAMPTLKRAAEPGEGPLGPDCWKFLGRELGWFEDFSESAGGAAATYSWVDAADRRRVRHLRS